MENKKIKKKKAWLSSESLKIMHKMPLNSENIASYIRTLKFPSFISVVKFYFYITVSFFFFFFLSDRKVNSSGVQ